MRPIVTNVNGKIILNETVTGAGSQSSSFTLRAPSFLLGIEVSSNSGTLNISAKTYLTSGIYTEVISHDIVGDPGEVVFLKAPHSVDSVDVTVTHSANASFMVVAKGLDSSVSSLIDKDTGIGVDINASGQMHVVLRGDVCAHCSSSTPLDAGQTFTGTAVDILDYAIVTISVYSDVASATNGLRIEQSVDGISWYWDDKYTINAGSAKTFSVHPSAQYLRVRYINGATPQGAFALTTIRKKNNSLPNSHRIQDSIINDDDAQLVKAVLTGENPAGTFVNFQSTQHGNFKISLEEFENSVSDDDNTVLRTSSYLIDQFGNRARMMSDNMFRGAPVVISNEHHEIHCGDSYEATSNFTLGNGATRKFLVIVPNEPGTYPDQNQKLYHMLGKVEAEGETIITWYEGADRVAGVPVASFNRNRNSSFTDTLNISYTPTGGTTDGIAIWGPWRIGSGRNSAGNVDRTNEFVLRNNTSYILEVTNASGANNNNINVEFDYYVHPGV